MRDQLLMTGRLIDGRYQLLAEIARGAMGRVYKARQLAADRVVALKLLAAEHMRDERLRRRFLLEAAVTARLRHPNTVKVFDYGETAGGECFIAMQLLEGETLAATLQRERTLPAARAANIAVQICRSLREAHGLGLIHRDLKPANVVLRPHEGGDFVKLLDFGLVKLVAGPPEGELRHGMFIGSPSYVAPEQARDDHPDPRADIYSLGVLLYVMLTGAPPFSGNSPVDIVMKHLTEPPPPLPAHVDARLARVVLRCLAKKREGRFQSVAELLSALEPLLPAPAAEPIHTPPPQGPVLTMTATQLAAFRAFHAQEREGTLQAKDAQWYAAARDALASALLKAQHKKTPPGDPLRRAPRVRAGIQVELELAGRTERTTTLDLTLGGFSVLLAEPPRVGQRARFTIKGGAPGSARVVNVQRKGALFRAGFEIEQVSPGDEAAMHRQVIDAALESVRVAEKL